MIIPTIITDQSEEVFILTSSKTSTIEFYTKEELFYKPTGIGHHLDSEHISYLQVLEQLSQGSKIKFLELSEIRLFCKQNSLYNYQFFLEFIIDWQTNNNLRTIDSSNQFLDYYVGYIPPHQKNVPCPTWLKVFLRKIDEKIKVEHILGIEQIIDFIELMRVELLASFKPIQHNSIYGYDEVIGNLAVDYYMSE